MAKGDHARVQNTADYQGNLSQNNLNNLRTDQLAQNQNLQNLSNTANNQGMSDYANLMGGYGNFMNQSPIMGNFGAYGGYSNLAASGAGAKIDPRYSQATDQSIAGYKNFADTGGYSAQDIQALRARAESPIRAMYQNAQADLSRNRALQGGYSPNYAAALAKMNRETGQNLGDAQVNLEASLADAIRQGKLAGLGGMNAVSLGQEGAQLNVDQLNNAARLAGLGGMTNIDQAQLQAGLANRQLGLQGLGAMSSLYSATPGMASMYGNQLANSNQQRLGVEGQQQALGNARVNQTLGMAQVPGNYQQALGNIGSTLGLAGQVVGGLSGMGGLFGGGSKLPSTSFGGNYGIMPIGGGGGVTY